jgi:ribosomal protein S18 acetylase RimI-like enzyme
MLLFRDHWDRDWPEDEAWDRGVARLLEDPNTDFLLASVGDAPASGVAALRYRHSLWQDAPDCGLEDLYVEEEARRHGVGQALVEAAVERATERGCRRVELDVNENNEAALALYEKLDFSSWSDDLNGHNLFMRHHMDH